MLANFSYTLPFLHLYTDGKLWQATKALSTAVVVTDRKKKKFISLTLKL